MLYTRSYQGVQSVTLTRRSEYEVLDDVTIENVETEDEMDTIKGAQIVGVTIHITCINCNSKLSIVGSDSDCVRCPTCNVLQVTNGREYEVSAEIVVKNDTEKTMLKVCAGNVLKILNADAAVPSREMEKELLQVQKVDIIYTKRNNYVKDILKND